ncbi:hypothetical protein ACGFZK_06580 [Streptomyces sp. NPDC048257]|uniref:hypothetical protein n=1 Tax=Streptomyces sp. NPDC048257 TaxID=3365526 RepID=UPI003711A039
MNGIAWALRALHRGEEDLAQELLAVAGRHRAEHEVHHIATDLAGWSFEHVRRLAEAGATHGLTLDGVPAAAGRDSAPAPTEPQPPGLLLLTDLRELHVAAARSSLHWEMLAQTAKATHDQGLTALAASCHPQTLRQMRWTNTMIKNLCPQVLTSS